MNDITPETLMQMVSTIVAGMMANSANGTTELNIYNLGNTIARTTEQVTQGLNQVGIQIASQQNNDQNKTIR